MLHKLLYLLMIFIGGGFFGWGLDTISRSWTVGYFAPGTMLPYFSLIFAFGAVMLFVLFQFNRMHFWLSVIIGTILCVALEFVCGLIAYGVFDRRFWDYSAQPFNLYGFVDLRHSVYWFILTFLYRLFFGFVMRKK